MNIIAHCKKIHVFIKLYVVIASFLIGSSIQTTFIITYYLVFILANHCLLEIYEYNARHYSDTQLLFESYQKYKILWGCIEK